MKLCIPFRYEQNTSKTVREDYLKLFEQTIKAEFLKVTNKKGIFLTSTPSNANSSSGQISGNPNDPLYGDGKFCSIIHMYFNFFTLLLKFGCVFTPYLDNTDFVLHVIWYNAILFRVVLIAGDSKSCR